MISLNSKDIFTKEEFHIAETILTTKEKTFLHTHDFCELFLVTQGSMVHLINGKESLLQTNALCLVFPEDIHQFKKGDCMASRFTNIAFPKEVLTHAISIYSLYNHQNDWNKDTVFTCNLPPGICESYLFKVAYLTKKTPQAYELSKKEMLLTLVVEALSYIHHQIDCDDIIPQWLTLTCEKMTLKENYVQGLKRFIELSGKSQEHLSRSMRKFYNTTPANYLNMIQLEAVAQMLKNTEDSILDILLNCGFNNVSYFNQLFKREYGITPTRYRQINKSIVNPIPL